MASVHKSRRTFPAAEALDSYRLVTLVAGEAALCDAAESPLGVTEYAVDDGDLTSVRLLNTEGTIEVEATGAVAAGGLVVAAAAGMVAADPGAGARILIGLSLATVTAGGVIEIVPYGYGHNLT